MGLFDKFKKEKAKASPAREARAEKQEPKPKVEKKEEGPEKAKKAAPMERKTEKIERKKSKGQAAKTLVKPLITEKVTDLGMQGKYVFEVAGKANKIEISKAIESVYGVRPTKVNVIGVSGKRIRHGRTSGRTKDWKKAIVTLKPGEKIEVYKGV